MKFLSTKLIQLFIPFSFCCACFVSASDGLPLASIRFHLQGLTVTVPTSSHVKGLSVVVQGPSGEAVFEHSSDGSPIVWILDGTETTGSYRYEAIVHGEVFIASSLDGKLRDNVVEKNRRTTARFKIKNGQIIAAKLLQTRIHNQNYATSTLSLIANWLINLVMPVAHAQDIVIGDPSPELLFNDTNDGINWVILGEGGTSSMDPNNIFRISSSESAVDHVLILNSAADDNTENSIVVESNGDISLADGDVFVDRSSDRMGIGTNVPMADLEIQSLTPGLRLDDTTISAGKVDITLDDNDFLIEGDSDQHLVNIDATGPANGLTIDAQGRVGIGTNTPSTTSRLHVQDATDTQLLVANSNSASVDQVMFRLQSLGLAKVRFAITGNGNNTWTFDNTPGANLFSISKVGTGLNEFTVNGAGHGNFRGNVTATAFFSSSSRAVKTDIEPVDERDVLAKVLNMPLSKWRYSSEHTDMRHVGPMAEDFYTAFGVSDSKHIASIDGAGIALAAIKGLHGIMQEKDAEIATLKKSNRALTTRLSKLERFVSTINLE